MFQGFEENTHFVKYYKFRLFKQLLDKERFQQSCCVKPRLANGIHWYKIYTLRQNYLGV